MHLDAWHEEQSGSSCSRPFTQAASWDVTAEASSLEVAKDCGVAGSECRRALQLQIDAAAATGAFVFGHRRLDGVTALALAQYLRDDCRAKFVDLSHLGQWSQCSLSVASALKHGLRCTRSLVLDGNAVGSCPEVLQAWCAAVEEHPGLQHLSLRGAGLDDRGAAALARALRRNAVLFSLDVGHNRLGDEGVNALADAIRHSGVVLDVEVDGTDSSSACQQDLADLLEQQRARFPGGGAAVLSGLRRARAVATAAMAQFAANVPAQGCAPGGVSARRRLDEPLPEAPLPARREATDGARDLAGSVFFEAGGPVVEELSARCEAGWRYNTAERDRLVELRARIGDMKIECRLEHQRADEILEDVAKLQMVSAERLRPSENRVISLKEELSAEIEATRVILQEQIERKMLLKAAEEELEDARQERFRYKLGAEHLEHVLKARNREVAEELQEMQRTLHLTETEATALEADNEKCRRLLHAMRFETDRERFVPSGLTT